MRADLSIPLSRRRFATLTRAMRSRCVAIYRSVWRCITSLLEPIENRREAVGGDHTVALSAFDRCPLRGCDISVGRAIEQLAVGRDSYEDRRASVLGDAYGRGSPRSSPRHVLHLRAPPSCRCSRSSG